MKVADNPSSVVDSERQVALYHTIEWAIEFRFSISIYFIDSKLLNRKQL